MPIKGSLTDMTIADILQMLSIGNKTGELVITNEENLVNLYMDAGKLTQVYWINREDKLGKILVKQGYIDQQTLNEVLNLQKEEPDTPIGKILIELDLIDTDTLEKILRKQILDTIVELSEWNNGSFIFDPLKKQRKQGVPLRISVDDILIESAVLQDEFRSVALFTRDSILTKGEIPESGLSDDERIVVNMIDGKETVASIMKSVSMDELKALHTLSKLVKKGIIKKTKLDRTSLKKEKIRIKEHRNLGIAFLQIGMLGEAVREFTRFLEIEPDNREILFYMGTIHFKTGEIEKARGIFNSLIKKEESAILLNNLSVITDILGDKETALKYIEDALTKGETNSTILLNKAILLIEMARIDEALETLGKIEKPTTHTHFYYSYTLIKKGKIEEALKHFKEGLKKNPQFGEYYHNLGKLYKTLKEDKKAVEVYKRGLEVDHSSLKLTKAIIDHYYKNGTYDLCERRIDAAISAGIEDWDLFFKKGNILFQKGLRKEAKYNWKKALNLAPRNQTIKRTIKLAEEDEENRRT
ncbi:tetratricopeptide repeat protein [candidate division WOR-3 bacterium]|nr:tetratricopeptide repeat protein [candidate division WOR-3 bacterium]MCK4527944.1 tetratricopeptide repeat protein [candidate division WOR-3 bacterium]